MSWAWRFLGRFPRTISATIAAGFAAGLWFATDYVRTVVEPREAAARQARIGGEIARADAMMDRGKYALAIAEYAYVIDNFAAELAPAEVARLHDGAGRAHVRLAEKTDPAANLESGIAAFARALEVRAAAGDAPGQAETQRRIGDARRALARARGDAAPLDGAVAAYRAMLALAGGDPARRAAALRAVANAHRDRFEIAGDREALAAAFAAYDEAMAAANPEEFPAARGATLIEVGLAWVQEAENGYRTRNLLRAVETLEDAKRYFDVDAFPRERARLHKHIGDAYVLLSLTEAKRSSERARHQQQVVRWQNRAENAYKVARSFGYRPAQANVVPGNPRAAGAAAAAADDKTE